MKKSNAIRIQNFTIKDDFWSAYRDLVRQEVLPYQHAMLEDQIPGAEKSHAIDNFRIAAGIKEGEFYGWVFQDSDLAKWIEACAYSLASTPDEKLASTVDGVIDIIEKAQMEDGYLNTYFTCKAPELRWTNLQEAHELYCAGHMIEAAVAYYEATGKDKLLQVMLKMADHIDERFGKDKHRGFPGHPEIELALMKLYRLTGNDRYRRLCEYFIDERGTEPNFYEEEKEKRGWTVWNSDAKDREYTQNQAPVREQNEATGHSVRAVYLYTAMADLAAELEDDGLKMACRKLWDSITGRRMYITGGIGSTVLGEAFTKDYDLPNDTAYCETCASIGLIFFAQKMIELSPMGEYADVMERALYNTVLAGMSLNGRNFFYVNPLEVTPGISGQAQTMRHVLPERPKWYGCACCPPNVARLITSLEKYAWSENSTTIFSNLYIGGETDFSATKGCKVITEAKYPFDGVIRYRVIPDEASVKVTLAIRIPAWSNQIRTHLTLNGSRLNLAAITKNGYAYIEKYFIADEIIELKLDMTPYTIYSDTRVRHNSGCTAIQCGPLIYCFEGADNGGDVHSLKVARNMNITTGKRIPELNDVKTLSVPGYRMISEPGLYSNVRPTAKPCTLTAVPYYTWGNRGLNQMRVWLPEE